MEFQKFSKSIFIGIFNVKSISKLTKLSEMVNLKQLELNEKYKILNAQTKKLSENLADCKKNDTEIKKLLEKISSGIRKIPLNTKEIELKQNTEELYKKSFELNEIAKEECNNYKDENLKITEFDSMFLESHLKNEISLKINKSYFFSM